MRRRSALILISLAVITGVALGLKLRHDRELATTQPSNASHRISILTYKGLLSPAWIHQFEAQSGIGVDLQEATDFADLISHLQASSEKNPIDAVSFFSYQWPALKASGHARIMDLKRLKSHDMMASDFIDLPGDLSLVGTVPTHWGLLGFALETSKVKSTPQSWREILGNGDLLNQTCLLGSAGEFSRILASTSTALARWSPARFSLGFFSVAPMTESGSGCGVAQVSNGEMAYPPFDGSQWKYVIPSEKAGLWVLSWTKTHTTRENQSIDMFFEALLDAKLARLLMNSIHQASTNLRLEEADLDARLKPSYLRQIPLTQIELIQNPGNRDEVQKWLQSARH